MFTNTICEIKDMYNLVEAMAICY